MCMCACVGGEAFQAEKTLRVGSIKRANCIAGGGEEVRVTKGCPTPLATGG